jgi:hypothetical protein
MDRGQQQLDAGNAPAQDELNVADRGMPSSSIYSPSHQRTQYPRDVRSDGSTDDCQAAEESSAPASKPRPKNDTVSPKFKMDMPTTGQDDNQMTSSASSREDDDGDLVFLNDQGQRQPASQSSVLTSPGGELNSNLRHDEIDLVVQSKRPPWTADPASSLAPPWKKRKTTLTSKSTVQLTLPADPRAEYDAAMLDYCNGYFVPKPGRGSARMPHYRRTEADVEKDEGANAQRRVAPSRGFRKVSDPREDANRWALVGPFIRDGLPLDENAYRSELRQLDVGSVQCWSPSVVAGTDQDRFVQQLSSLSQDLSTKTTFMEAVYRAGGLQDDDKTNAILGTVQGKDGEVKWENPTQRQETLASLAYTKDFAVVAKQLGCSVGNLLVCYYRWKGTQPVAYRDAKIGLAREREDCAACGKHGKLIVCESCAKAFHLGCATPPLKSVPEGSWLCSSCRNGSASTKRLCPSINRKSPRKLHGPFDNSNGVSSIPAARRSSPIGSNRSLILNESVIGVDRNARQRKVLLGLSRFVRPRGMIWDSSRNAWSRPPSSPDDHSTTGSTSDDLMSWASSIKSEKIPDANCLSSSDEEPVDPKNKVKDLVSSSSDEEDDEFQVPESESDEEAIAEGKETVKERDRTRSLQQTSTLNRNARGTIQMLQKAGNPTTVNRNAHGTTQMLHKVANPTTVNRYAQGTTQMLHKAANPTTVTRIAQGITQKLPKAANPTTVNRNAQGTAGALSQAANPPYSINRQLANPTASVMQPQMGICYVTHLPITAYGLLITVKPWILHDRIGACFGSYRKAPENAIGPAEAAGAFRQSGDVFLAIDNVPCEHLPFQHIVALLGNRVEGQIHKKLYMRTRPWITK